LLRERRKKINLEEDFLERKINELKENPETSDPSQHFFSISSAAKELPQATHHYPQTKKIYFLISSNNFKQLWQSGKIRLI